MQLLKVGIEKASWIFAIMSFISACLAWTLKETFKEPLLQSLEDAEIFLRKDDKESKKYEEKSEKLIVR